MSEKRIYKRSKVDLVEVAATVIQASHIEIINISLNGVSLYATRRLDIGAQYDIKLQSAGEALNITGVVVWSRISRIRKGFNGDIFPIYSAGLEFIDASEYLKAQIDDFIESHKSNSQIEDDLGECDPQKDLRRSERFAVHTPVEAFIIDKEQCHPVKDLSFGGFSIECNQPLKIASTVPMMLIFWDETFILFAGKIVSCRLDRIATQRVYTLGIAFSEMAPKDRTLLTRHIRVLSSVDASQS